MACEHVMQEYNDSLSLYAPQSMNSVDCSLCSQPLSSELHTSAASSLSQVKAAAAAGAMDTTSNGAMATVATAGAAAGATAGAQDRPGRPGRRRPCSAAGPRRALRSRGLGTVLSF